MTAPPIADHPHVRRVAERTRSARLIRDSIGLLSSKWSVDVLLALGDGTRRYHELLEDLAPISEKVLTQTLRAMERDGLLVRRVHAEVPPRVEYALSSLGATMAPPLKALGSWSLTHGKRVEEARGRFDARAAAREQLGVWADRAKVEIISQEGGDPAAVSFDAVNAGRARGVDVVIADTAGRLPTQLHLMEELKKIKRVITKAQEGAPHEVLLVVDGNTGQNALSQVKAFDEALGLTGLVVTKLDGTAKGGVLAAIARERPVPVYFIGVGEKLEDLETFSAREFARALLE